MNLSAKVCVALVCLSVLTSCKDWLYEDEGDCSVHYTLKFRYEKNLKWADAFANEVSSVHLYAFDKSGVLVWQQEDRITRQTAEDYSMTLDLPAGEYRLLAWCGLKNDGEHDESFSVPEARIGQTSIEQLECSLNRKRDANGACSDEKLYRLFHGILDVSLPESIEGGSYEYTMYLTKDTNHIRVILQHLSGEDVDVNQFTFCIEDDNGLMAHDNELMEDENITYLPWDLRNSEAGIEREQGTRALVYAKGAVADLTVARMTKAHQKKMLLTIRRSSDGGLVAQVPVIDYALMAKEYYEKEYKHEMTDQDFLDREDEYVMTFFLDADNKWISSQILIHSWIVILDDVAIE